MVTIVVGVVMNACDGVSYDEATSCEMVVT